MFVGKFPINAAKPNNKEKPSMPERLEHSPSIPVFLVADRYQEAADLIYSESLKKNSGDLAWVACINATLAVEIYLKSFLARNVLTKTESEMNLITQETAKGHDLLTLYKRIDPQVRSTMTITSQDLDPEIKIEKIITHCKDYFFLARYSYELSSRQCLNSEIIVLAQHMKKLVRKIKRD